MPGQDDLTLTGGSGHLPQDDQTLTGGSRPAPSPQTDQTLTRSTATHHDVADRTLTHTIGKGTGQLIDKVNWEIGDIIDGRYEVVNVIGRGGKGIVYKVNHLEWQLELAVKMPLEHLVADEMSKIRFIREAQTWVDLGLHPNIVQCWYVRELGGMPRVFMDYIGGGSLKDWIKNGKIRPGDWDRILDLMIQACDGLGYAHERGVEVHRDVKPGNMLLTARGELRVTDFGIVKREGEGEITEETSTATFSGGAQSTITITGSELGTPEYGAPEQWGKARHADSRADIYALGVVLFEMCCGRRPFDDGTHREPPHVLIGRHLSVPPPDPRTLNGNIGNEVAELILQCLAKDPEQRPASMAELREQLVEIYKRQLGKAYRRPVPQAVQLRSDALNNRAVSLLDLGQREEAFAAWKAALKLDPYHPESLYNQTLIEWRECKMTDDDAVRRLRETAHTGRRGELYLGYIHLERAAADQAEIALDNALDDKELATNGAIWRTLGDTRMAQVKYGKAEEAYQKTLDRIPGDFGSLERQTMAQIKTRRRGDLVLFPWRYCLHAFEGGHDKGVTTIAMTPSGRFILSGSTDMTLKFWNVVTRSCIWTARGHDDVVLALAVTPDGKFAVSGSQDMTLKLWKLATGKCLWTGRGHQHWVTSVAVTPNGRFIVSGSRDKTLRLWSLTTGKCIWVSEKHPSAITALAVEPGPDARFVLSGHDEENLYLWDLATGKRVERKYYGSSLERLGLTSSAVSSLLITPKGEHIVTGSRDQTVRLWNFGSGEILHTYKGHEGAVTSVAATRDGQHIISGSVDETVRCWDVESEKCLWVFDLHEDDVTGVVVDPDGQFVISSSLDKTMRHIDLDSGKSPWTFGAQEGHQAEVTAVATVAGKRFVVSTSRDLTLRLWELRTARCVRVFEGPIKALTAAVVTPDRRFVIGASQDTSVWMWELLSTKKVRLFEGHKAEVMAVAVTPDGQFVVSGSADKTIRLWNLTSGKCVRLFKGHSKGVTSLALTENGQMLISGSSDNTIRLWELQTATCVRVFEGHTKGVTSVGISKRGDFLVSGSEDRTIRLWNLSTGECLKIFRGHKEAVTGVALPPDERFIVSGSRDRTVRLWEVATTRCLRTFTGHTKAVTSIVMASEGQVASSSEDGTLRLWELELKGQWYEATIQVCRKQSHGDIQTLTQRFRQQITWAKTALKSGKPVVAYKYLTHARSIPSYERAPELLEFNAALSKILPRKGLRGRWFLRAFKGHDDGIAVVVVTPDGRFAVSGSKDSTLRMWDLAAATCVRLFEGHKQGVTDAIITPDGRFVVSSSKDGTLRLWDLATAKCFRTYTGHKQAVNTVAIAQYGRFIVSGGKDATLRLWNPATAECLQTLKGHNRSVTTVTVSPDKRLILSGSEDKTLRLWNHTTGKCLQVFRGHRDTVTTVQVAANGNFFISGGADKTIRIWDFSSAKSRRILRGHEGAVTSVVLTPNARFAVSGSADRTLRLWDVAAGECLGIFEQHRLGTNSVAITPDGRFVLSGSDDKTLHQWELDWELDARETALADEKEDAQSSSLMNRIASLFNKYEKR